ncbi:MAG: aminoacetone oxidase family FAD-binding enzyme [Clostridia bacterium]|nr:aminoacetone oxidase family FAD-binding enzyme [Clostridia bacterium]
MKISSVTNFDVIIVGGGSSALFCAAYLSSMSYGASIAIVETNLTLGKKLSMTGNGRCNLSNTNIDKSLYNTDDRYKLNKVLNSFSHINTIDFFENKLGVLTINKDNLIYPATLKSSTVTDGLRYFCKENNVHFILNTRVTDLKKESSERYLLVTANNKTLSAKYVVLATGGASYPKTGSDGRSFALLKNFTQKEDFVKLIPSLVQLKTKNTFPAKLSGTRVRASVSINNSRKEVGELLFTDYGISGILVMQLSGILNRYYASLGAYPVLSADLLPDYSFEDMITLMNSLRDTKIGTRKISMALQGIILSEVVYEVINESEYKSLNSKALCNMNDAEIKRVVSLLKELKFRISGSMGFDNAQVTSGGLKLAQVSDTMELIGTENLYVIGEMLNVDGPCGGYNLQWAWSSAVAAAGGIYGKL